jgi:ABC-type polysaccharide/polyol phosphate export permease
MYLTPVIYPTELFPDKYRWIFQINFMAVIINAYRQVILAGAEPNYRSLAIAFGVSIIVLLGSFKLFKT